MESRQLPPRTISIGSGSLVVTSEAFLNGYQAGHLAYMADGLDAVFSDTRLTTLIVEKLERMEYSDAYNTGFVVGWITTLVNKGTKRREGERA